jgi:predicted nucleic acid-binding protein
LTKHPDAIRVFLDASVLFAAALSATGSARDLVLAGARGAAELVVSNFVVIEVERNLQAKAPRAVPAFQVFQQAGIFTVRDPSSMLVAQVATIVEPKDAPIVAGAITASASYVASYDRKHLLSQAPLIAAHYQITVAIPNQVLRMLAG